MLKPKLPSFFKSIHPKKFEFTPRYYDANKERIDKRIAEIEKKMEQGDIISNTGYEEMREKINENWSGKSLRHQQARSNQRIIIIAAVLLFVIYLIFFMGSNQ